MAKSILHYCLVISLGFLFVKCRENDLPKPTQQGANTFGCKINGKSWKPTGGGLFSGIKPISAGYMVLPSHGYKLGIYISASGDRQHIRIMLNNIKIGNYNLREVVPVTGADTLRNYASYEDRRGATYLDEKYYATNDKFGGQVVITRSDSVAKVISGTFNFKAVDSQGGTATISGGRFDVKYPL